MSKLTIEIGGKEYPMTQLKKALQTIGKIWRKNARISLRKQDKVNTGALYNSMSVAVQGASRNIFSRQSESPFKFGSGNGPRGLRGAIDKWVAKKGFQFSDKKTGRFMSFKSTAFVVSRAIYNRGLKPTFFISDTLKRLKPKAMQMLSKAMNEDMANVIRLNLKLNKNLDVK